MKMELLKVLEENGDGHKTNFMHVKPFLMLMQNQKKKSPTKLI